MRVYILCPTGQRMMFHMLMLLEADSGERGAEIAPLSSVFQISLSPFHPFYIWPCSPFPLRSSTHHFLFSLESLIHFMCVFVRACACICGDLVSVWWACDVCIYGEMISEAASAHVN